MNEFFKGIIFYFLNYILNKIPSRRIRIIFYNILSLNKISLKSTIGLNVKILDIRGVEIGDHTNVNFDSILDGRGKGLKIGSNVDISPQVNIWTLGHDARDHKHSTQSGRVEISDGCWLANRVTVLPGTTLKNNTVVAAGSIVQGVYPSCKIIKSTKAQPVDESFHNARVRIKRIRSFR